MKEDSYEQPHVTPADPVEHDLASLSADDFPLQKDKQLLAEWRSRLEHLHIMQDFIKHPAVAEFVKVGLERIETIDRKFKERDLLINPDRAMERVALAVERDMHESYLAFFDVNPTAELNEIAIAVREATKGGS